MVPMLWMGVPSPTARVHAFREVLDGTLKLPEMNELEGKPALPNEIHPAIGLAGINGLTAVWTESSHEVPVSLRVQLFLP